MMIDVCKDRYLFCLSLFCKDILDDGFRSRTALCILSMIGLGQLDKPDSIYNISSTVLYVDMLNMTLPNAHTCAEQGYNAAEH